VGVDTRVKVMTDGILLAELQRDRLLHRYDTLVIDEAHERSLNIDFILGYLRQLLPRRPDLKVVITSATIDTERFSAHFDDAPVIEVSGRAFPVEMRYRPLVDDAADLERDQIQAVCDAVRELCAEGPGDILTFLSGEREIRDTADALTRLSLRDVDILPLYARLSIAEQHRVFAPHPGRRVVLATNVAETSLTVPGVRYVVDAGTARISRYNRRTKVQRLPIEPVSQASADQRAGRCGRVGPGVCIRLYDEDDYLARPAFTEPEILRTNLASVILQMASIGLGDVAAFPFVDPPDARNIRDGIALLEELGALEPGTGDGTEPRLTSIGRQLAQLPVDPRLGRMVLEADRNGCVHEVMVLAAALSLQDPRERPLDKRAAADELHARFADPSSDFVGLLNLWRYIQEQQDALSSSQFRRLCRAEFLNYLRVREWQDVYRQLRQVTRSMGIRRNAEPAEPERIHRSLLAGLLSHIGMRDDEQRDYVGARSSRFAIGRGSALFDKPPRWVMAAELVETTRTWARVGARIQPEWAERLAGDLVKRSYGDAWWDAARGAAMTLERVTLFGLPVVAGRRIGVARVDPVLARSMFIRHALVEGEWEKRYDFLDENRHRTEAVRELEDRARRPGILVDEQARIDFYDERIGPAVSSGPAFDRWWKARSSEDPARLTFPHEFLRRPGPAVDFEDFPLTWRVGDVVLDLSYRFEPGAEDDGVAAHVPLAVLNRIDPAPFEWQVPGLREELVTALIRSLPKPIRKNFVPAPDVARSFVSTVDSSGGSLIETLSHELTRRSGIAIPYESWQLDRVPDHLRVTFLIEDDRGEPVASGKDLDALRDSLRARMRASLAKATPGLQVTGARKWVFGTIARSVESRAGGHQVAGFPALVDEGETVGLRVVGDETEQARSMWAATRRLLRLTVASPIPEVQRSLRNDTKFELARGPDSGVDRLLEDCLHTALDALIEELGGPAWDEDAFDALRAGVRAELPRRVRRVVDDVARVLEAAHAIEERLDRMTTVALQATVADVGRQLSRLVFPGFVAAADANRLADMARYLTAIERRLDKVGESPARDRQRAEALRRLEDDYDAFVAGLPPDRRRDRAVTDIRWLLEELRVNTFAQALGTKQPVSEARIRKAVAAVAAT